MRLSPVTRLTLLVIAGAIVTPAPGLAVTLEEANPVYGDSGGESGEPPPLPPPVAVLTGYAFRATWLVAAGGITTLIDFETFADGTLITTELIPAGISLVSGSSPNIPGPTSQFVTASTSLPFPMFNVGDLPSEPNFLSNDLAFPGYATGEITFTLASPTTAIGAFVADSYPLDGFAIELFDGAVSLGTISVPPRVLPDAFVGVVSDQPFDKARFFAVSTVDSWGLDDVEFLSPTDVPALNLWGIAATTLLLLLGTVFVYWRPGSAKV